MYKSTKYFKMKNKDKDKIPMKNRDIDKLVKAITKKNKKNPSTKIAGLAGLGKQFNEKKKQK